MASNLSQSSLLNFGFQHAVNPNLLPVFGPANLPVYGPQPKRLVTVLPVQKQKAGRPKKQVSRILALTRERPTAQCLRASQVKVPAPRKTVAVTTSDFVAYAELA